ncbi:hypothetical protein AB0K16_04560 [Nonomuraea jabiensis]
MEVRDGGYGRLARRWAMPMSRAASGEDAANIHGATLSVDGGRAAV